MISFVRSYGACVEINYILSKCINKSLYTILREIIPLNSTIEDLILKISKKHHIKEQIIIQYKSKFDGKMKKIEPTQKIKEVKDLFQEQITCNKTEYFIYINIANQRSSLKNTFIEKKGDYKLHDIMTNLKQKKRSKSLNLYVKNNVIPKIHSKEKNLKMDLTKQKHISRIRPNPITINRMKRLRTYMSYSLYTFEFNGMIKKIKMYDGSRILGIKEEIRREFMIPKNNIIVFYYEGTIGRFYDTDQLVRFKNGIIKIKINQPTNYAAVNKYETKDKKIKCFYQLNNDKTIEDLESIEINSDVNSVINLKEMIAIKRNIEKESDIKIYLDGHVLQNKDILTSEKIKNKKLVIYITDSDELQYRANKNFSNNIEDEINPISKKNKDSIVILDISQIKSLEIIKANKNNEKDIYYEVFSKHNGDLFIQRMMNEDTYKNFKFLLNEHEILRLFDHQNILKSFGIYINDGIIHSSILLEHWSINLDQRVKKEKLSNTEIINILYKIAEGMRYIHSMNVIHRNLNPESIVFTNDSEIKISEFGHSTLNIRNEIPDLSMNDILSPLEYIAPEMKYCNNYDEKVDVYAFGILTIYLINGGSIPNISYIKTLNTYQIDFSTIITQYCENFILKCINFDPEDRPSFETICMDLASNYYPIMEISISEKKEIETTIDKYREDNGDC